jgi:beta-1,4-mannosyl-glycoprotein beta-1,4-N-acetylglucosaminyltransferase
VEKDSFREQYPMKIFDCTTYYSEDLMLEVRFNILNEHVHKFIIVESKYSHSGKKKELNFNIDNFKKFKDKIVYLVIENEPENIMDVSDPKSSIYIKRMNSLKRIEQSYDYMLNGIKDASDEDLIILNDNDEIPNLNSKQFLASKKKIIIFEQLFCYYKFNLLYDLVPWYGSRACKKKYLKSFSWLKNLKNKKYPFWRIDTLLSNYKEISVDIIKDGGWHFTNVMSPEKLFNKLNNFGHHNEFELSNISINDLKEQIDNKMVNYNHLADKTDQNKYKFNYKLKNLDNELLPEFLRLNKTLYKDWFN